MCSAFCNFYSLQRYLKDRSHSYSILDKSNPPENKDEFINLPGVGTFSQAMKYLDEKNLTNLIKDHAEEGGKILGICLGMQLFFNHSEESKNINGLGLIKGKCIPLRKTKDFMVPHIGWNEILVNKEHGIFNQLIDENCNSLIDYYFVHSYVANPIDKNVITSYFTHPDGNVCASVKKGNVIGFQFHPEKSGYGGYVLLDKVFNIIK